MKRSLQLFVAILFLFVVLPSVALAQGDRLTTEQVDAISQSVVRIEALSEDDSVIAAGSGLIVSASGFIYTNRHVVERAADIAVYMLEDPNEQPVLRYYAKVISVFELDFAILQVDRNERGNPIDPVFLDLPFVRPEETEVVRGDSIFIFGYPGIGDYYMVLTQGTITTIQNGTVGEDRIPVWYQTDAEIAPGNSGGVAVNIEGKVVGIPTLVAAEGVTGGRLGGILPLVAIRAAVEAGPTVTEDTGTDSAEQPTNPDGVGIGGEDVGGEAVFRVEVTNVEHNVTNSRGEQVMRIGLRVTAPAFISQDLRTAVFFLWDDRTTYISNEDAPGDFRATDDSLTIQEVITLRTDFVETTLDFPYSAFPNGLSGEVDAYVIAMLSIDGGEFTSQSDLVSFTLNYDSDTPTKNVDGGGQSGGQTGGGVAITCTGTNASFSNGVEVVVTQMRSGFTYTATVIGLNGFDPVLAVLNQPGRGTCDDDTQGVRYYEAFLPTTGVVARSNQTAQISFTQNTGQVFGNVSLVVGGFGDTAGEFLLILEGMAVTEGDNLGDIFAVRLTPGMVTQATPISVYMVGIAPSLDPYFYLANPSTYLPLTLDGGLVAQCDDAGGDNCFVGSSSLIGSSLSRTERRTANADRQDAMLVVPIEGFELDSSTPMYLNFVMNSFEGGSFGDYLIAFHMGTR